MLGRIEVWSAFRAYTNDLDQVYLWSQVLSELCSKSRVMRQMQLHGSEARNFYDFQNLGDGGGGKDTDTLNVCGQPGSNPGSLIGGYAAFARGEDEAESVGSVFNGEQGIGKVGSSADLYPHGVRPVLHLPSS